ncbi:C-X-C chemokine receptor type 4-B [Trichoplax sp. H2]|nr:C-X-C chemokine receptor type 4-B [Trichoplax sp. H2]|eukprot:RDD44361.1 C-X-C chemokine receptor type 4-B [Trichoplax sp. H2]
MNSISQSFCSRLSLPYAEGCIFKNPMIIMIFCLIYAFTFFHGTFCCFLVCKSFWLKKKSFWKRDLFYFNLTISDLLLILVNTAIGVFISIYGTSGSIGCKFNTYLLNVSLQTEILAISFITYNRYRICSKYFHQISSRRIHDLSQEREYFYRTQSLVMIIMVWIMVMFYNLIYLVFSTNARKLNDNLTVTEFGCDEAWPSLSLKTGFYGLQIALFFILPLLFFIFCYSYIFFKFMRFRPAVAIILGSFKRWLPQRKFAKLEIIIVLTYFVTKTPYYLWVTIHSIFTPLPYWSKLTVIIFATLGSCINPIIILLIENRFNKSQR